MVTAAQPAALHGPAPGEGPPPRFGPVARVAALSDVHGNIPALEAVLSDVDSAGAELVVFCGDLTWGPEPHRTVEVVRELGARAVFVRGNADRAAVQLARHGRAHERPRDPWMIIQHTDADLDFLAGFAFTATIEVVGLGPVRFCHGSPRSDTELITPATPPDRFADLSRDIDERVLVSGHTHIQFDRTVAGRRSVNPGSVGLPYHEGAPGTAYWALLGPDVELRQSRYDLTVALDRAGRVGDPSAELQATLLTRPPTPAEVTAHGESLVFSD